MVANHEEKPDWLPRKELEITAIVIAFDQVQVGYVKGVIYCNLRLNMIAQCC
jgi:hypothetical protein